MAVTRIAHAGAAASTTLSAGISNVDTSISITAATGWPSGNPFFVVIDPSLAAEEKILCTRSGTTLTASARGADSTSAASHSSGATVYPCLSAQELDEANRLAATLQAQGSLIIGDASGNPTELVKGTSGHPLVAGASTIAYGQLGTTGIADSAVTTAKIGDLQVTAGKIAANTITAAEIAPNAIGASELADNAVDTAAIVDANVTLAKVASEQWTSYTPTLTQSGAVTKTVTYARYMKVGRMVTVALDLDITGAGTAANEIVVGLPSPVPVLTDDQPAGVGVLFDQSVPNLRAFHVMIASTTTFRMRQSGDVTGIAMMGATGGGFELALANLDQIRATFTYEATA